MKKFGYFKPEDKRLENMRYANYGSRNWEYYWAATVESIKNKHVLDTGCGIISQHNWPEYVQHMLEPASYTGIDFDARMKNEEIHEDNHKMLWMDMTDLKFPDDSFDFCYSISTFEHLTTVEVFQKAMKEIHRVLKSGSKMVLTLDERWDKNYVNDEWVRWDNLEIDLLKTGALVTGDSSFSMKDFAELISDKFIPADGYDIKNFPVKSNTDQKLLHNKYWNSCVSYGVFEVVK